MAQLSLVETALWPLDPASHNGTTYETSYSVASHDGEKGTAVVTVWSYSGLLSVDEYNLWGLLALTLQQPNPQPTLMARPYWLLKQLGYETGGFQYRQLRESLERLAKAGYQNTAFYNPLTQQHERVTFSFCSTWIPTIGKTGLEDQERTWRIEWPKPFFEICQATGGRMLFDLETYRKLSPASRRLFLKLQDRFWRSKRVHMNVDDLTINGLGFSASVPLKVRKQKLIRCIKELLKHDIITLGRGQTDPKELFIRRGKGVFVVVFYEGAYFKKPATPETSPASKNNLADDPLYEPLKGIGFDEAGIRRCLRNFSRGLIQKWIKITETAMHENPKGFPGFKVSPAAFCYDGMQHDRMPPDWVYAHEKQWRRRQWELEREECDAEERQLRTVYEEAKTAALKCFVAGDGREAFETAVHAYTQLYAAQGDHQAQQRAIDAAIARAEQDPSFEFPAFSAWVLKRPESDWN